MGKASMMLDFICELERVIGKWPEATSWTLAQIADKTKTGVPQVVDILSDTLDRELEVHETLTQIEAAQVLSSLKERMSGELAARQKRLDERREKAIRAYDNTMEKVRVLLAAKNWRNAYKTLGYYVGCNEKDLPDDLLLTLCGECLRLGAKSETNMQELSQWLRKGINACMTTPSAEWIEEAIDFIDAYGQVFMDDSSQRGKKLIENVLETIKDQAAHHNLMSRYDEVVRELRVL